MQPNENVSLSSCDAWKKIGPDDVCQTVDFNLTFLWRTIFLLHAMMIKFWHRFGWKLKIIIFTSTLSSTHPSLPHMCHFFSAPKICHFHTKKKHKKSDVSKWLVCLKVTDLCGSEGFCGRDGFLRLKRICPCVEVTCWSDGCQEVRVSNFYLY